MAKQGTSVYKIVRWCVLVVLIAVIALMLKRPDVVAPQLESAVAAEKARSFEAKLEDIEGAQQRGEAADEQHFDTQEVNAFIETAARKAAEQGSSPGLPTTSADVQQVAQSTTASQSSDGGYSDVGAPRVSFSKDEVIAQVVAKRYGQDIYVTVKGHLASDAGGYVTFHPTEFQVGSLPVPVSLVEPELQKRLAEPDMHERLKLPAFISAVRVQDGQLVIVPR